MEEETEKRVKVSQSPRIVHKVYESDASVVPLGFKNPKQRPGSHLSVTLLQVGFGRTPERGISAFHFRDNRLVENRRPESLASEECLLVLTVVVNLAVDPQPGLLFVGTKMGHDFHQVAHHLFTNSPNEC